MCRLDGAAVFPEDIDLPRRVKAGEIRHLGNAGTGFRGNEALRGSAPAHIATGPYSASLGSFRDRQSGADDHRLLSARLLQPL